MLGNQQEAEDAVQDIFIKALIITPYRYSIILDHLQDG
jgi:DNA-directed RNA polymerase specialized sigma24 family protein